MKLVGNRSMSLSDVVNFMAAIVTLALLSVWSLADAQDAKKGEKRNEVNKIAAGQGVAGRG